MSGRERARASAASGGSVGSAGSSACSGRRDFIRKLAAALAVGVVAPGCASVVAVPVTPVDGRIRLRASDYPGLGGPGGYVRLRPEGFGGQVYLLATETGHVALSPVCTHLGCTVEIQGARLECPCHGSTYDRGGRVLRGPAERALRSFPVRSHPDGTIEIDLSGEDAS